MKHKEVAQRRLLVREEWLARTLQSFNDWVSVTYLCIAVHAFTFILYCGAAKKNSPTIIDF